MEALVPKIRWWLIVLVAIALEIAYGLMAIGGFWVGSRVRSRRVLQAVLVGVVAVVFYTLISTPAVVGGQMAVTLPFLLNHLAKILGATAGGLVANAVVSRS